MARCTAESATIPVRRFAKHQSGKGARFFLSSPAMALVYTELCRDKSDALRQERLIKKLQEERQGMSGCVLSI
jgi:predicted GIY-YIG superfamily endonuclease